MIHWTKFLLFFVLLFTVAVIFLYTVNNHIELLNDSLFVKRGRCGQWDDTYKLIYQLSNLAIFVAYTAIPMIFVRVKNTLSLIVLSPKVQWCFVTFIFFCGIGHLEGVLSFYWPAYHLFALWSFLTAITGWYTVLVLSSEANRILGH